MKGKLNLGCLFIPKAIDMLTLYPPIKSYVNYELAVDPLHTLYVEECGNPKGVPILFLHGGPGGGCGPEHRRFFDPERYRIILYDQRGCGRSKPHAELTNNTTFHLLEDIEKIREHCHVSQWLLFGGSWGSTLALIYAQHFSHRVMGMILRGIFLCRTKDIEWFYQQGASRIFPDLWADFLEPIASEKRHQLLEAYYQLLTGEDDVARMNAAKAWSRWEAVCSTLNQCPQTEKQFLQPYHALAMARIECHYFRHQIFLEDNFILNNMKKIQSIPGILVHGRYDMICPLDNAIALYERWPEAQLNIIRDAGHSAFEPGITSALIHATNSLVS